MENLIKNLNNQLEGQISVCEQDAHPLRRIAICIETLRKGIEHLISCAEQEQRYPTTTEATILFNKVWYPPILAKCLFFQKNYQLEYHKLYSTASDKILYCENELKDIRNFFITQHSFSQYFYSGATDKDWILFKPNTTRSAVEIIDLSLPKCANQGCLLAAQLIANEQYSKLLQEELKNPSPILHTKTNASNITWNYKDIDLVEHVLGQYASKTTYVDGQPATQEFLIKESEQKYGRNLKNWRALDTKIRARKKEPLPYHDILRKNLLSRNDQLL